MDEMLVKKEVFMDVFSVLSIVSSLVTITSFLVGLGYWLGKRF